MCDTSYWGRRAFEKHFQEWRHAHGMKCLRLENSKHFHEITRIQDALELDKKLKQDVCFFYFYFLFLFLFFIFFFF